MEGVFTAKTLTVLIAVAAFGLLTSGAGAAGVPSDPDSDSPAGAVYQLPLDNARSDAAPRRPARSGSGVTPKTGRAGGSQDGGESGATPTSALRSENGFGSSSIVPGTDDESGTGAGSSSSKRGGAGAGVTGGEGHGQAGGAGSGDADAGSGQRADASTPSSARVYLLLALVLAVGVAGGMATRIGSRAG